MRLNRGIAGACLLLVVAAAPVSAQVEQLRGGSLSLRCGGIGLEASQRMRAEVAMHALTLLFSSEDGAYLTDVQTRVDNPLGNQSVEVSCGPIAQIDVSEAGNYRITATYEGVRQEHWVELVPGGGASLSLRWRE
ncbi:hypothetical protein [Thauera sp.]|uniref:hypothetical protein n=1 Tax=Thauera sp. TaxID=1905334 RepID=UPI002BC83DE5|nr:hypothetical protein [Thauera sp.]HRP25038.1 hypothetical protein [Thauera sp.]